MVALAMCLSEALLALWQELRFEVTMCFVTLVCALVAHSVPNLKTAGKAGVHDVARKLGSPWSQKSSGLAPHRCKAPTPPPCSSKVGGAGSSRRTSAHRRSVEDAFREIVEGTKENTSIKFAHRALQVYQREVLPRLEDGVTSIKRICESTGHPPLEMYSILVTSAVRVSSYNLIERICQDMNEQGISRTLSFYESAMRQLAKQRQHHLAIAMYDMLDKDGLRPSEVTLSCLIVFAAEIGELQRAVDFFEILSSMTTPCIRGYMAVLRVHAKRQDYEASIEIVRDMEKRGVGIDSFALNIVLATCVAAGQMAAVEQLVSEGDARKPPSTDVISYNTMMKAWAQQGDTTKAKAALGKMQARGLKPNEITFNTAMDAMVRGGRRFDAWGLLDDMRTAGLKPDKFTCSILIKCLRQVPSEKKVLMMLKLLMDTDDSCEPATKPMLYNHVLEAAAQLKDRSNLLALALSQMRRVGVQPSPAARRFLVQSLPAGSSTDSF